MNLDVFRSDYSDLQVSEFVYQPPPVNDSISYIQNAALSRSQGIELEGQWAVTKEFRLGANVTYLDSHYVNYPGAAASQLQNYCSGTYTLPYCAQFPTQYPHGQPVQNLSGQPTAYAPRVSGSVTASYRVPITSECDFAIALSPYFTSSYYINGGSGDYTLEVGRYVRLDGRLTLETSDGRFGFDVIGKNLTNRIIITNPGLDLESKEEPWNVAAQARYKF